jgi:threonine aldolase
VTTGYVEHGYVELRSDTFTRPTPEMYDAMVTAPLGDDVWGEDPTVNALQDHCARLFGKEAGLFVSSGSMGNQLGINALSSPGDTVEVDEASHVVIVEVDAPQTISGVSLRTLPTDHGLYDPDALATAAKDAAVVCLENTHMNGMGAPVPLERMRAMAAIAHDAGARVHLDGARIFNAAVALGVDVAELTADVDTVTFCFSKGLGAPIGSMLLGTREAIAKARGTRKLLGGGTRQAGIIAAAARVAVETGPARLHEDHANAARLAEGIASIRPGSIDVADVRTNILLLEPGDRDPADVARALDERGVKVSMIGGKIRCITHKDVNAEGIERALDAFRDVVRRG